LSACPKCGTRQAIGAHMNVHTIEKLRAELAIAYEAGATAERELAEARAELKAERARYDGFHATATQAIDEARARVAELEAEARVVVEDQSAHSSLCGYLALDDSPCDCRLKDLSALVPPDVR
jgi:vacuolar-type H+-ATPase subunit I/STV1